MVVASEEALAHIAGSWVGACWAAAAVDTVVAVTEDILVAPASAWEGTADSHAVGRHLAAAVAVVAEAAHTDCTGRSDSPGAASRIADPWRRILRRGVVTESRGMGGASWAKAGCRREDV